MNNVVQGLLGVILAPFVLMALAFILPAPMSTDWLAFGIPLAAVGGIALFLWRGLDRGAIALGLVLGIAAFVGLVVLNYYNAVSA